MRRTWYPLGYQILHAGQILRAKPGARPRERTSAGSPATHEVHASPGTSGWPDNHANPRFATSRGQAASKGHDQPPRSGPPLQQQVLAIAGASWPVEPGNPLLPDLVTRGPAAGRRFVQDRDPRPEQELGVGVRRAVGLGDAVREPQRRHALVGPVDLAEHVAGLTSEPNDPGRPLACRGGAVSVHIYSMPGRALPGQWQ